MVFACAPNFRAKAAAKKQALKQKLAGAGAYHGVSLRLLLVDRQVDAQDVLPHAALGCVHVIRYDAKGTTLAELVGLIREAHRQNGAPFLSMAIAQHGADAEGQWAWTTDLTVNLKNMHGAIDQLAPVIEVLAAALSKTKAGKAHIDLLACNLATTCKGLIPALEKMYGIDFRASTDETGNDLSGGDWKMETDNDYDVAADYLDAAQLKAYTETMAKTAPASTGQLKFTEDEIKATKAYCGSRYRQMNEALREPARPCDAATTDLNTHFASALKKTMEQKKTTLHRGISGPEMAQLFGKLKKGVVFTEDAFVSSSACLKKAQGNATNGGVLFSIEASLVSSVAKITGNNAEEEYVFLPGSQFKVLSNKKGSGGKGGYKHHVTVQQVWCKYGFDKFKLPYMLL